MGAVQITIIRSDGPCQTAGFRAGKRLAVTPKVGATRRWTVTHIKTGNTLDSLLPASGRSRAAVLRYAKAIEAIEHPAWALMESLGFGQNFDDLPGGFDHHEPTLAAFARAARAALALATGEQANG